MKTSRKFAARLLALLMVAVLLTAGVAVSLFGVGAQEPQPTYDPDSYLQLSYDEDSKTFSLLFNADKLQPLLDKGWEITTDDLRTFMPDGLLDALKNHQWGVVCDILGLELGDAISVETLESIIPPDVLYDHLTTDVLFKVMNEEEYLEWIDPLLDRSDLAARITDEMKADGVLTFAEVNSVIPLSEIMKDLSLRKLYSYLSVSEIKSVLLPAVLDFVLTEVSDVKLDDTVIYSNAKLHVAPLVDALLEGIPTLAEFGASDSDILLDYSLTATVRNTPVTVNLALGLYGDTDSVKNICTRISYLADAEYADGTLTVKFDGGASLTKMYANLLASPTVSDELKLRVVNLFNSDGAALRAAFEATTAEELMEILSYAEPGSLEAKLYGALLRVDNFTDRLNSIKDRVVNSSYYANYADNIVELYDRLFRSILAEYSTGDGEFDFDRPVEFDAVAFLAARFELIDKAADYMDETTVLINVDVDAKINGLYQLRVNDGTDDVYVTLLPEGADLALILGQSGIPAVEWTEDGHHELTVMPAKNVVLHPFGRFFLTFLDGNGNEVGKVEYHDGDTWASLAADGKIPAVPAKAYYENGAWVQVDLTALKNYDVTATYTPIEYTVTYDGLFGATNPNPTTYNIESATITLADITRAGYDFLGWFDGGTKVTEIAAGSNGDRTLVAKWAAATYKVTYENTKDATNTNPTEFTVESGALALTDLAKDGYRFLGWFDGASKVTEIPAGSMGDITLTAEWEVVVYTVTFKHGDFEFVREFTVENKNIVPPALIEKDGYTAAWVGYDLDVLANQQATIQYTPISGYNDRVCTFYNKDGVLLPDLTKNYKAGEEWTLVFPEVPAVNGYVGAWDRIEYTDEGMEVYSVYEKVTYTVAFYAIDAQGKVLVTYREFDVDNMTVTAPEVPAKFGYTGAWEEYTLKLEDMTVHAIYTAMDVTYILSETESVTAKYDKAPEVPEVPGYIGNWVYTTGNDGSITANADYIAITYSAVLVIGDVTVTLPFTTEMSIDALVKRAIAESGLEPREGYEWAYTVTEEGVSGAALLSVKVIPLADGDKDVGYTSNLSVDIYETPIKYNITFKDGNTVVGSDVYTVEDKDITVPAVPTKAGFTGAWETYELTTGDVEVRAVYTPITYYVTFVADGNTVARVPFNVTFTDINLPAVPAKEGFIGAWDTYELGTADLTVNAVYTEDPNYQPPDDGPDKPDDPVEEPADLMWLIILLAVLCALLVVAVVVLVIFLLRKKPTDEDDDSTPPEEEAAAEPEEEPAPEEETVEPEVIEEEPVEEPAPEVIEEEPVEEPVPEVIEEEPVEEPAPEVIEEEVPVEEVIPEEPAPEVVEEEPVEEPVPEAVEEEPVEEPAPEEPAEEAEPAPVVLPHFAEGERAGAVASALSRVSSKEREEELSTLLVTPDGRHILVKYRKSFRARIIQAEAETKTYYSELKNYLLSFEGITASDSFNYESFGYGRKQVAKINISGKTVILFLAIDPAELEGSKYKYDNVGDKKRFEKTPIKVKVRSPRSFKWAKELIDMAMERGGYSFVEERTEDYVAPFESRDELIARDLIEVTAKDVETGAKVSMEELVYLIENGAVIEGEEAFALANAIEKAAEEPVEETPAEEPVAEAPVEEAPAEEPVAEAPVEEAPAEETVEEAPVEEPVPVLPEEMLVPEVTVTEAQDLLDNTVAVEHIEHRHTRKNGGKLAIVNVDTLDANFENGDTVDLETLKAKGIVGRQYGRVKILARGRLTKALRVTASGFSLDAVKMILLTGGNAIELD